MFKPTKKAFTLIELLVVIAIIGILVTIAVIALNSARSKARDAKRVANIKQVQTALELFFNDKNRYPTLSEYNSGALYSTSSFNGTTTYMEIVPEAPTPPDGNCTNNQNQFSYTPTNNGGSYTISYCLGNPTGSIAEGPHCATPSTIAGGACDGSGNEVVIGDSFSCPEAPIVQYENGPYDATGLIRNQGGYYRTVKIGNQCWLRDNLNVGNVILCNNNPDSANCPVYPSDNNNLEKYCYRNITANCDKYGALYNFTEALNIPAECYYGNYTCDSNNCIFAGNSACNFSLTAQGICPTGWRIPSSNDWQNLSDYLGGDLASGSHLKESGTTNWINDSCQPGCADNSSGFSALPAGIIDPLDLHFYYANQETYFLSNQPYNPITFIFRTLHFGASNLGSGYGYERQAGFSLRCLKN